MGHVTVNTAYPLRLQMADGNTAVYPRGVVYNSAGGVVTTIDLTHLAAGLYTASYTFVTTGHFTISFAVYSDSGHTTLAAYDRDAEDVEVTVSVSAELWDALVEDHLGTDSMGEAMAIIRGMTQQNFILDQTVHNGKGLMTSGRIRIFKNKTDTDNETSPIATYTIATTPVIAPNDGFAQKYKVTRNP